MLKEIAPRVTRIAALFNPAMATFAEFWLKPFKAAASTAAVRGQLGVSPVMTRACCSPHKRAALIDLARKEANVWRAQTYF